MQMRRKATWHVHKMLAVDVITRSSPDGRATILVSVYPGALAPLLPPAAAAHCLAAANPDGALSCAALAFPLPLALPLPAALLCRLDPGSAAASSAADSSLLAACTALLRALLSACPAPSWLPSGSSANSARRLTDGTPADALPD